eukprot:jgi/Galph1/2877/GphlegSOOS_G1502.1
MIVASDEHFQEETKRYELLLFQSLVNNSPRILSATRRAAVAIILRFAFLQEDIPDSARSSLDEFLHYVKVKVKSPLQILYIKRSLQHNDPWSGHVAFPGGRQEPGETDLQTAIRETKEEIGIDLGNRNQFICIGRISDREIKLRGRGIKDSAYCAFVFLQTVVVTPPLELCISEVAATFWVPLDPFLKSAQSLLNPKAVSRKFPWCLSLFLRRILPLSCYEWLAVDIIYFSGVSLGPLMDSVHYEASNGRQRAELKQPIWLWGLTLAATADLLLPVLGKRIDEPFITPGNRLLALFAPSKL